MVVKAFMSHPSLKQKNEINLYLKEKINNVSVLGFFNENKS